jgi:hypothetical protein
MLNNDKLTINLLRFSISQSTVYREFYISEKEISALITPLLEGGVCIINLNKKWAVYYHDERYTLSGLAIHDECSTAADDFFFRVTQKMNGKDGMYLFRERWERSTGLRF